MGDDFLEMKRPFDILYTKIRYIHHLKIKLCVRYYNLFEHKTWLDKISSQVL